MITTLNIYIVIQTMVSIIYILYLLKNTCEIYGAEDGSNKTL
jgi:hypothetical protein